MVRILHIREASWFTSVVVQGKVDVLDSTITSEEVF